MTREQHLQWCKDRANEYLNRGDVENGVTSMLSDMGKHEETSSDGQSMAPFGDMVILSGSVEDAKRFVNGFK